MTGLLDLFTIVTVSAGALFFLAGTVGLLRFPDAFTRLHALTKADNLGLGLIVLGLLPRAGGWLGGFKLVLVWLLVLLSGAVIAQLVSRAAWRAGPAGEHGSPPDGKAPAPPPSGLRPTETPCGK